MKNWIKASRRKKLILLISIIFGSVISYFIFSTSENGILVGPNEKFDDVVIKSIDSDSVVLDINNRWGPAGAYGREKNRTVAIGETFAIACDKDATLIEITGYRARFKMNKAHESLCAYQ